MYQVTDPGFTPTPRVVPASKTHKDKGHYTILVRRIPWVKWRDLAQSQLRVMQRKQATERLLDAWAAETPETTEEIDAWNRKGGAVIDALNTAERELDAIVREVVAWGIAGTKDLVDAQRVEHPFSFTKIEWLGKEWPLLSEQTLDLYHLLGLLPALFSFVSDYQHNKLPETLDGFFPPPPPKAVPKPAPEAEPEAAPEAMTTTA